MSEWQGAGLENRCRRKLSGFESQSLRQFFSLTKFSSWRETTVIFLIQFYAKYKILSPAIYAYN